MKRFISLCLLLAILLTISTPLTVKAQISEPPEDYLGKARNLMANMTPEQRIGQLFLVSFKGTEIGPNTGIYRLITEHAIGGVVLRADNDNFVGPTNTVPRAADLVRGLHEIAWTQSAAGPGAAAESPAYIPLFVGISQEGDLYPTDQIINGLTAIPSPMAIGATWDPQLAQAAGLVMGKELRAIGFNLFIGPSLDVLDVPPSFNSDDLGIRTFGGDPFWVGEMGKAYIRGLHLGSRDEMAVIAKHFPGRGSSDRLPEEEVATVRKPLEQLKQVDLAPFFAVTDPLTDRLSRADGLLVSHIRYQGLRDNIRDVTPPVSLDSAALEQVLNLQPIADWYRDGGLVVSDNLGSDAVRRFYDPTMQSFDARSVARNAFLAGNDLLYLNNFVESIDPDSETTIIKTLESFAQKYREDPAFAERVDRSVERILALKIRLYPSFTLDGVLPDTAFLAEVGRSQPTTFEIARRAVTLISPDEANLEAALPSPPAAREQMIIFTDVRTSRQCSVCAEQAFIEVDAFKNSIVRLFGPGAGGQINASMIHAYSYQDLISYLNDPLGSAALGVNLNASQWVIFVMQDSSVARPETNAVNRLLSERSDLIREKKVVGFAFNAPYYLDATDIAKLTAYFGIYSKIDAFMDVAARVLFHELSPVGDLPVSVPGVGYDLIKATSPDPAQVIPLSIDLPEPAPFTGTTTPEPTTVPVFGIGDTIPLKTGVIYDTNGNPVPDGTVVRFIFSIRGENGDTQQFQETTTVDGIARSAYVITDVGELEIRVISEPATTSQLLRSNLTGAAGAGFTPVNPTSAVTETPQPTATAAPSPTPAEIVEDSRSSIPRGGDWFLSFLLIWGSAAGIARIGQKKVSLRWGVRWGLMAVVGGMLAYLYLATGWFEAINWFASGGTVGVLIACAIGILVGWGAGWLWQKRFKRIRSNGASAAK